MTLRLIAVVLATSTACSSPAFESTAAAFGDPQREQPANATAAALKDFSERIDAYLDLRNSVKGKGPALKETDNAAAIKAAQETLAANIRHARADAKPGDIFTPAIRAQFRQLLYPELKGEDGRAAKRILKDDAPPPAQVPLKVNAPYVADSKPSVPVNLLVNMPKLPMELEYRIVGKHLVLVDVDANLIVDFVPNAIQ